MTLKLHQWGPWVLLSESVAARYGKMKGKRKSWDKGEAYHCLHPALNHRSSTLGLLVKFPLKIKLKCFFKKVTTSLAEYSDTEVEDLKWNKSKILFPTVLRFIYEIGSYSTCVNFYISSCFDIPPLGQFVVWPHGDGLREFLTSKPWSYCISRISIDMPCGTLSVHTTEIKICCSRITDCG